MVRSTQWLISVTSSYPERRNIPQLRRNALRRAGGTGLLSVLVGAPISCSDRPPVSGLAWPPEGLQHPPCSMESIPWGHSSSLSPIALGVLTTTLMLCKEARKRDRLSCRRRRGKECEAVMLQQWLECGCNLDVDTTCNFIWCSFDPFINRFCSNRSQAFHFELLYIGHNHVCGHLEWFN